MDVLHSGATSWSEKAAPWSLGVWVFFWVPGGCPGASISDLCAIGGGSHFGLGWGWALLVYWRRLCGMYCGVMYCGVIMLCLIVLWFFPCYFLFGCKRHCGVMVLGWYMYGVLVGGLLVVA